ncbi:MAG: imidazole glycerol phosphate synthase subunit HisH [Spirochaetaceae bacterium]|nr:imidazole glycerol phosphate synthase subunit HisH [Spirochaetaceae bacterium]|tara:strand:+ start:29912 stop:30559 length:648 start_codon:yes stop_codon:yes gene_type:complete
MDREVLIVDYGIGNLHSVARAFEFVDTRPTISSDPEQVSKYSHVVLPGVGAFGNGMEALRSEGMDAALNTARKSGSNILAICLGMQLLMDESEEFGTHQGLGFIPGKVSRIPSTGSEGQSIKIPHIGWSRLYPWLQEEGFRTRVLEGFEKLDPVFYFVHSYQALPEQETDVAAVCKYEGNSLTAIVERDNVVGCQFHPEKSGSAGLQLIRNFVKN